MSAPSARRFSVGLGLAVAGLLIWGGTSVVMLLGGRRVEVAELCFLLAGVALLIVGSRLAGKAALPGEEA